MDKGDGASTAAQIGGGVAGTRGRLAGARRRLATIDGAPIALGALGLVTLVWLGRDMVELSEREHPRRAFETFASRPKPKVETEA